MTASTAIVPASRAQEVHNTILQIRHNLADNLIYLGELLSEARREGYAEQLGYASFGEWLDQSGLDMSERHAYYLIKIIDNAQKLGIDRKQLQGVKMSKLKEIFTLDPEQNASEIKELVAESSSLKLDDIRDKVHIVKKGVGQERLTWCNFKVSESQAAVIHEALERVRLEHGQVLDGSTGETIEITDARALELICADFLSNPSTMAEIEATLPIEGEYV